MRQALVALVLTAAAGAVAGAVPDDYAMEWELAAEHSAAAYRVRLDPEVYRWLADPGGRDLAVFDATGAPVPVFRLDVSDLVETRTSRHELNYSADAVPQPAGGGDAPTIELELRHGGLRGTRLSLQVPAELQAGDFQDRAVFQALIEAPVSDRNGDTRTLVVTFQGDTAETAAMDCRLRDADEDSPATRRLVLRQLGDSRPRRFEGRTPVDLPPRAWHLVCYARAMPAGLVMEAALLETGLRHEHAGSIGLTPKLSADPARPGEFHFELDGPYLLRGLRVRSAEPNVVAQVNFESRPGRGSAWSSRGQATLSTVNLSGEGSTGVGYPGSGPRHREWRIRFDPPLRAMPEVALEAYAEEVLFLAQGESPWRLHAGSARANLIVPERPAWFGGTLERTGPAWTLPLAHPGTAVEAGGQAALRPPPVPIPWFRYLLWSVLVIGAGLVVWLAFSLVRAR